MTPKEAYEARRAERRARMVHPRADIAPNEEMMLDLIDRFVTAVERIADAVERSSQPGASGG